MYNEPLSVYREYIQNAVDSIDVSKNRHGRNNLTVKINLDPSKQIIRISDNGTGISAKECEDILSSIGSSNKRGTGLRGFRGIGRLGGIAFCDKAIFRTKAKGETIESLQEWDCGKLRYMLDSPRKTITLRQLFESITEFKQNNNKPSRGSYFEVTLHNVARFRNYVFDIEKIRDYLSQVVPVPFNYEQFPYGESIDQYLSKSLSDYGTYNISLNGVPIYKPYQNLIMTSMKRGGKDHVDGVRCLAIKIGEENGIAYGWYGIRRDLLGSIRKGEPYSGIRVRIGNILLGSAHLLDRCFREARFNSYMIGEIHVESTNLIPNSRRDDFVDNESKTLFYNAIEREIGLPISKEIRYKSRVKSATAQLGLRTNVQDNNYGKQKLEDIDQKTSSSCNSAQATFITKIKPICKDCPQFKSISKMLDK
jgi:molecular chaperone HtpG